MRSRGAATELSALGIPTRAYAVAGGGRRATCSQVRDTGFSAPANHSCRAGATTVDPHFPPSTGAPGRNQGPPHFSTGSRCQQTSLARRFANSH